MAQIAAIYRTAQYQEHCNCLVVVVSSSNGFDFLIDFLADVAWEDAEVDSGQEGDAQHGPDKDIVHPEVAEKVEVLDLCTKQHVDCSVARIDGEAECTELHSGDGDEQQDPGVDQEGVHQRVVHLHRVDLCQNNNREKGGIVIMGQ
jgi:hypothetical protein